MEHSWEDTLPFFLQNSNEDERIVSLFNRHILPKVIKYLQPNLNWLEIGCGDCNKTNAILNLIQQAFVFNRITLDVVEPCKVWLGMIENIKFDDVNHRIYHETLQVFTKRKLKTEYNFVTLIQILYDEDVTNTFFNYLQDFVNAEKQTLIFISVENNNCSFNKIRQQIIKQGIAIPTTKQNLIIEKCQDLNLKYEVFKTRNKKCWIDIEKLNCDDNYWVFPFILGCSTLEFIRLSKPQKALVLQITRSYINNLRSHFLNINDTSILIYCQ